MPGPPRTVPEQTDYARTSSYDEVIAYLDGVDKAKNPRLHRTSFGQSEEGRELPLLIYSNPPVKNPVEARALGVPVVLVMANIHAGEVEGKEACLELLREMAWERPPFTPGRFVLLVVPIYNPDGNDRFGPRNRPLQQGPSEVGQRPNADGLDLNRDFMKAESAEARALLGLMREWDPMLTVDLHTTDGSAHGYALTYAPPLTPSMDPKIASLLEQDWLPELRERMRDRHGYETFDYGNFAGGERGVPESVQSWNSFDHRPRFGTNYIGLRNRAAILSEAYSYLDFETRIAVTRAFVVEILNLVAERGPDLQRACAAADRNVVRSVRGGSLKQHIAAEMVDRGRPETVLLGAFEDRPDPQTGEIQRFATGTAGEVQIPCLVKFRATQAATVPACWWLPPESRELAERLVAHGIVVQRVDAPQELLVQTWSLLETKTADRLFQGHYERSAAWETSLATRTIPAGSWLVPGAQPLARLVFQLLSPNADDGLLVWGAYDPWLEPGQELPLYSAIPTQP